MLAPKDLAKRLIVKYAPVRVQRRLRRQYVALQVLKDKFPPEPEAKALPFLVTPGSKVADVGANVGVYTRQFSTLVGNAGHVYSFEPVSENLEILEDVLRLARLGNVTTFHAALGSAPSHCEVVIPDRGDFTGFYWAHVAEPGDAGKREAVEMLSLDSLVKKNVIDTVDFIKCDVEGGELEVMRGAVKIMRAHHPAWLLEVSRKTSQEVFEMFRGLGYQSFVYTDRLEETPGYRDGEFSNYIFLYAESNRRIITSHPRSA